MSPHGCKAQSSICTGSCSFPTKGSLDLNWTFPRRGYKLYYHFHKKLFFCDFQMFLLSKKALLTFSTGHVIDLVSNDVQRLEEETVLFFFLATLAVLELALVSFLLVFLIGWQTLIGVIFLCFLVPYFAGLSYAGAALRLHTATVSDHRNSLINQMVSGIRAIKTHAWEDGYHVKMKIYAEVGRTKTII